MRNAGDFQLAFAEAITRRRARRANALERQPGFAVYRNTTPCALIETLRGHYPVADMIVGEQAFDQLALEYARLHPPADPILLRYGDGFADFLEAQPWVGELPYLPGVARLERLWTESHLAADAPVLDAAGIAALGAEAWMALRLPLHPASRFTWQRTPAVTIWQAHRGPGFDSLEPEWRAEGALFTRPGGEVRVRPTDPATNRLLHGLRLGETVGEAAAAVARVDPKADVALLFATLVAAGAFALPPQLERSH